MLLKKYYPLQGLLLCLAFAAVSCGVNKELQQQRKGFDYDHWEQQFKDRALCRCLLEGLGTPLKDSIFKHDKSFYDPLAIGVFDPAIDPLLQAEIAQIKKDSLNSIGKYPADIKDLLEGKRVMSHCLSFYRSDRLDQAMKKEKKRWKKIPDIVDEITKTIPTF